MDADSDTFALVGSRDFGDTGDRSMTRNPEAASPADRTMGTVRWLFGGERCPRAIGTRPTVAFLRSSASLRARSSLIGVADSDFEPAKGPRSAATWPELCLLRLPSRMARSADVSTVSTETIAGGLWHNCNRRRPSFALRRTLNVPPE